MESEVYSDQNETIQEESCFEENLDYENLDDISASEEDILDESVINNENDVQTDILENEEDINGGDKDLINTKSDLINLSKRVKEGEDFRNRIVVINADIDMTDVSWEPIGTATKRFRGSIDGRGHSIKNLTGGNFISVMEITEDVSIRNLKLENYSYTNAVATGCGGLVGSVITTDDDNQSSLIINHCSILGKIVRDSDLGVGGVIGYIDTSGNDVISIDSCDINIEFNGKSRDIMDRTAFVGGIIGASGYSQTNNASVYITKCSVYNDIITLLNSNGHTKVGGLIGNLKIRDLTVKQCRVLGNIECKSGASGAGGAFGQVIFEEDSHILLENMYINATMKCQDDGWTPISASGFIGRSEGDGSECLSIVNCYVTGSLQVGWRYSAFSSFWQSDKCPHIENSFFNMTTLPLDAHRKLHKEGNTYWDYTVPDDENMINARGLTDDEMKDISSYTNWNFNDIWAINYELNDGYPDLRCFHDGYVSNKVKEVETYSEPEKIWLSYESHFNEKQIPVDIRWNLNMFRNSSDEFDVDLAKTAAVLAQDAYSGLGKVAYTMEKIGFEKTVVANDSFDEYSFSEAVHVMCNPKTYFGYQRIRYNDGEYNIFCVDVRGTSSKTDTVTDLLDGSISFQQSAENVKSKLCEYMVASTGLSDEELQNSNNIFFIMGHSLGGATSNRLSIILDEYADDDSIFTYTFESPHTCWDNEAVDRTSYAHNIINVNDFVTKLPNYPTSSTFGNNYFFDSDKLDNDIYRMVCGGDKPLAFGDSDIIFDLLTFKTNFRMALIKYCTDYQCDPFHFHWMDWDMVSLLQYEYEMENLVDKPVYSRDYYAKWLSIACPVDVKIYDGSVLVAESVDGIAKNYRSDLITLSIYDGDKKIVYINSDKDFTIEFIGLENGEMTYTAGAIDYTSGDANVLKEYSDVQLEEGKRFVSLVDTDEFGNLLNSMDQNESGEENNNQNVSDNNMRLYVLNDDSEAVLEVSEDGEEKEIETPTVYTVYYDSDGGNEIAPIVVRKGTPAVLPQPPVKEGFVFKGWQIDGSDYDFTEDVESNITLKAVWEKEKPRPAFNGHSLLLSGEIGVNFRVDYPSEGDYSDSVMRFDVGGYRNYEVPFSAAKKIDGTENSYRYTCYVNSLGMADEINATLTYGDNAEIENRYSVKQYVDYIMEHQDDFSGETVRLVESISDYGHYVQPFITESGVTDGYEHIGMTAANEYEDDVVQAAKAGVSQYRIDKQLNDSGISNVYYSLSVDSKTTVNVYLEAENNVNIESAEVTGTNRPVSTDKVTRNGVEYYHVAIKNLSADELGDVYKIDVKTDQGEAVINLSAMTYVYSILNSSGYANNLTAHYAVTALYNYYMATKSYVESIT